MLTSKPSSTPRESSVWGAVRSAAFALGSIPGLRVVQTPADSLETSRAAQTPAPGGGDDPSPAIVTWDPLAAALVRRGWTWRWLLVAGVLFYGVVEKLVIPGLFGYLRLAGPLREWTPHLEALLSGFLFFPAFLAFYLWSYTSTDKLFSSLKVHALQPSPEVDGVFQQARQMHASRWWCWACVAGAALIVILIQVSHWADGARLPPWFGDRSAHRILSLAMIGLIAYAVLQLILRLVLAAYWLRHFCERLSKQLVVNPYHPDGAGGLGRVGKFTLWYSNFVLLGILYVLLASFVDHFQNTTEALFLWSPLIIPLWIVALLVMPILFIGLLFPTHQAMCEKRDEQLSPISQRLFEEMEAVRTPEGLQAVSESPEVAEEIQRLKVMRQVILDDFPVWPVSTSVRRQFRIAVLAPFAQFLITMGFDLVKLNR